MPDIVYWSLVESAHLPSGDGKDFLSPAELQKLSSLRFPKRRDEWLLGRWTAKSLVKSLPACQRYSLAEIEVVNTPAGVPEVHLPLGQASPGCLSISHRSGLAFCALAPGTHLNIGADLEAIEPREGTFTEDYFTPGEQALVAGHPGERHLLTTLIWSAKEAMLKALGVGLRWDTRQVEILEIEGLPASPREWQRLQAFTPDDEHQWSVSWQRRGNCVLTLAGFPCGPQGLHIIEQEL
jgi:4'-phosphopantetheinyl transferase